jgi:hypothetical protein
MSRLKPSFDGELIDGAACTLTAVFTDLAGAAFTPSSVRYRVDSIDLGAIVQDWTAVLLVSNPLTVTVTAAQNRMTTERTREWRRVTVEYTDTDGIRRDLVASYPMRKPLQPIFDDPAEAA